MYKYARRVAPRAAYAARYAPEGKLHQVKRSGQRSNVKNTAVVSFMIVAANW